MNNKKKWGWVAIVIGILTIASLVARLTGFNVFDIFKVSGIKDKVVKMEAKVMTTPPIDERVNCIESDIGDIKEGIGEMKTDIKVQGESVEWLKRWAIRQERTR